MSTLRSTALLGLFGLMLTPSALAIEAAVAPFVPLDGDDKTAYGVTSIVSSEMEFMSDYDFVEQLDERPSGLKSSCVISASCLRGATQSVAAEHVMVGTTRARGEDVEVVAVLFDRESGAIVRQQDFTVPKATMTDDIGPWIRAVVTGDEVPVEEPALVEDDFFSEDDEFTFDPDALSALPEDEPIDEFAFDDEPAFEPEPEPEPLPEAEPAFEMDPDELTFNTSPDEIGIEDIQFDFAVDEIAVEDAPAELVDHYEPEIVDEPEPTLILDGPSGAPTEAAMMLAARAGYAAYQDFDFVTWGAELSIPMEQILVKVGLEGFSSSREIPTALQPLYGDRETLWETVPPLSVGVAYQTGEGALRPYIGADATFTLYMVDFETERTEESGILRFAPGARARAGADFMVTDTFGLNLNASGGIWYARRFDDVLVDASPVGFVPQVSAGTVVAF